MQTLLNVPVVSLLAWSLCQSVYCIEWLFPNPLLKPKTARDVIRCVSFFCPYNLRFLGYLLSHDIQLIFFLYLKVLKNWMAQTLFVYCTVNQYQQSGKCHDINFLIAVRKVPQHIKNKTIKLCRGILSVQIYNFSFRISFCHLSTTK